MPTSLQERSSSNLGVRERAACAGVLEQILLEFVNPWSLVVKRFLSKAGPHLCALLATCIGHSSAPSRDPLLPLPPLVRASPCVLQFRRLLEDVEPPGPVRYVLGALLMLVGVVLPLSYMMFRTKKTPPQGPYKQT